MPPSEPFRLGHRPELDGLRGLAILAVLGYHTAPHPLLKGGYVGVDLFFVLSGFLITARLLEDHQRHGYISLKRFYLRRVARLAPALLAMLAACCLFAAFKTRPERAGVIYQAVLLTACNVSNWNWVWRTPLDLLGHTWSLSLEEQFYLCWPILLAVLLQLRADPRRIVGVVLAGIVGSMLIRVVLWQSLGPAAHPAITANPLTRADSLLAGCLVGLFAFSGRLVWSAAGRTTIQLLAWVSAAIYAVVALVGDLGVSAAYLSGLLAVAGAVGLAALVGAPPPIAARLLSRPPLVWLGRVSYGLYLWHFPMLTIAPRMIRSALPVTRQLPCPDWVLAFAAAFAVAALSYYRLERPVLRWAARLDRLNSSPIGNQAPGSVLNSAQLT